jgi:hypothetical protein
MVVTTTIQRNWQNRVHKTNTTQYVLDTTIRKQTQHNMCWTPLYVLDTTIRKQTQHNMCWTPLYVLDTTIRKQTQKT